MVHLASHNARRYFETSYLLALDATCGVNVEKANSIVSWPWGIESKQN
jgi:hypothetical protein